VRARDLEQCAPAAVGRLNARRVQNEQCGTPRGAAFAQQRLGDARIIRPRAARYILTRFPRMLATAMAEIFMAVISIYTNVVVIIVIETIDTGCGFVRVPRIQRSGQRIGARVHLRAASRQFGAQRPRVDAARHAHGGGGLKQAQHT
jgi:hypothetical protein